MNVPLNKATIIVPIPIPTIPWNKNKDMIKDKIRNVQSKQVLNIFKESNVIGTIEFDDSDCVRNPIIPKILQRLREFGI